MYTDDAVILLKVGMGNMTLSIIISHHRETFCHDPLLNPLAIISIATTTILQKRNVDQL